MSEQSNAEYLARREKIANRVILSLIAVVDVVVAVLLFPGSNLMGLILLGLILLLLDVIIYVVWYSAVAGKSENAGEPSSQKPDPPESVV